MRYTLLLIIFLAFTLLNAVIDEYEMAVIAEMMESVGLKLDDVNFAKNWSPSAFTIPIMLKCLDEPWAFPPFVEEIKDRVLASPERGWADFYHFATETVYQEYLNEATDDYLEEYIAESMDRLAKIKKPLDILKYVEWVYSRSEEYLRKAFAGLTPEEMVYLQVFLYARAVGGSEDAESYAFIDEMIELPEMENYFQFYIDLIKKVDFEGLVQSGRFFFKGLEPLPGRFDNKMTFNRPVRYKTRYGEMIVGTTGNDVYSEDFAFIYEPGGDDVYTFNMSTVRYPVSSSQYPLETRQALSLLAIIDMGGDDVYRNDQFGQLFNATFGNVFHYDDAGNDHYFGGDLAFSGNLGNMISIDNLGDSRGSDTYVVGSRSLGAGNLGVGILVNIGGNDYYYGTMYTQGMGGTLGFGALIDLKAGLWNNDCYHAGGKWTDSLRDQNDYYAMGQGCGFGLRPSIAGGIGLLFDESGNDKYNGGVFSQGVSYWYAMGILIDIEGADFYNSCWYPQGSGIHLSVGFLYDGSGDDNYFSKRGPGQGAGHDWGVGFFVDRAGNDTYSVDGGNGMGRANSVGVFVDSGGNDRYERKGYANYGSSYHNYEDRNSGNIGIFLDAGGNDTYSDAKCGNNAQWVEGVFGIGRDMELDRTPTSKDAINGVSSEKPAETSQPVETQHAVSLLETPIAELFTSASYGRYPANAKAKEALIERETEFVEYFMDKLLQSNDIMVQITSAELVPKLPLLAKRLPAGLDSENPSIVSSAIYYLSLTGDVAFIDRFAEMLVNEDYARFTNSIIQALGRLKSDRSVELISPFINSESPYRRTIVARALLSINTPQSRELLNTLKDDDDFIIRAMIIRNE